MFAPIGSSVRVVVSAGGDDGSVVRTAVADRQLWRPAVSLPSGELAAGALSVVLVPTFD
jgi:hypothetical protein